MLYHGHRLVMIARKRTAIHSRVRIALFTCSLFIYDSECIFSLSFSTWLPISNIIDDYRSGGWSIPTRIVKVYLVSETLSPSLYVKFSSTTVTETTTCLSIYA